MVALGEHPAGLVRYRMNGRAISLFLLAEPVWGDDATPVRVGSMDFRIFQRRGLDLVGWSHAPLSYLLVSEDGLETGDACAACHGDDTPAFDRGFRRRGRRAAIRYVNALSHDGEERP